MALTKKGSRLITVDGIAYRWRIRGKPTYDQALCERPLTFAIEQAGCKGSVLLIGMPQDHPSNWFDGPPVPVLPSTVAAVVREALAEGWRPSQPAAAFHMAARRIAKATDSLTPGNSQAPPASHYAC